MDFWAQKKEMMMTQQAWERAYRDWRMSTFQEDTPVVRKAFRAGFERGSKWHGSCTNTLTRLDDFERAAIARGSILVAIRHLRDRMGISLIEAKRLLDPHWKR